MIKPSLLIVLAIIALVAIIVPSAQAQDTVLFESYHGTEPWKGNATIRGDIFAATSFLGSASYTLDYVRFQVLKVGTSGDAYVSLQRLDESGDPNGVSLSVGILFADNITESANGTWLAVDMSNYDIQYNVQYALVVSSPSSDEDDYINFKHNTVAAAYSRGARFDSVDSGITWTEDASPDGHELMFEVWGEASLSINSVKVFQGFRETDDWLFAVYYTNRVNPFFNNNETPERWFNLQLLAGNCTTGVAIAQSPIREWGDFMGSVYLNADATSVLEWGGNYSIRLYSSITSVCTELVDIDWIGLNLNELDTWVIQTATDIGDRNNANYVVNIAKQGLVLNEDFGGRVEVAIPELQAVRSSLLFQITSREHERPTSAFNNAMQDESDMEARLGTYVYGGIKTASDEMGIEVGMFGFLGLALIYIMMSARGLPIGHTGIAMLLSTGFLFLGLYTGTFQWVWFALIGLIASALFIWHTFLRQT